MKTKETQKATVEEFTLRVKRLLKENLVGLTEQKEGNVLLFRLVNGQEFELKISEVEKI